MVLSFAFDHAPVVFIDFNSVEFFFRPQKKGYTSYFNWKLRWQVNSQCEPGVKLYFTEEVSYEKCCLVLLMF